MARKKKRLRPGSPAPAPEPGAPAAVDAEGVLAQAPTGDDAEAEESLTPAPAPTADSDAASATHTGASDQPLPSTAESAPAGDSLPAAPDGPTTTEAFQAADAAAAASSSIGPADDDHPDKGLPTEPLHQGSEAGPKDDAVVTEAPLVEDVDQSLPLEPLEDAYPRSPLPATLPDNEPFAPQRIDDPVPTAALPVDQVHEPAEPADEQLLPESVEDAYATGRHPATQPDEVPITDEHESDQPAPAPSTSVVPAPDVADDRAAAMSQASTDYTAEESVGGPVGKPVQGVAAWRRLLRMGLPRATKANLLGGLLAVLLGLAIATQVQLTQERGLSQLSQTDLIRVLDDVSLRSSRLDAQIRELEATRDRLRSGTGSSAEALAQAQKRVDTLGILAGTVAATGPGVVITLNDPGQALTGPIILDLIQELRDAGAEAIDVGGVRVVASSFVAEVDGDIAIDGIPVTRPITIKAIGDAKTLSSAMTIPGGIVETVRQKKASARVVEQETVEITSLHSAQDLKNARVVE